MQRSPRSASTLSLVTRVHQAFHRLTPAEQRELTLYPPDPAMQTPEPETHTTPTRPPSSHMTMPGKPGGRICCRLPFQWVPGRLRFVSDRPSRSLRCSRRATGINLRQEFTHPQLRTLWHPSQSYQYPATSSQITRFPTAARGAPARWAHPLRSNGTARDATDPAGSGTGQSARSSGS